MSRLICLICISVLISAFYVPSAVAADYEVFSNAAIPGHNKASIVGSVARCKDECDRADWCKSFDYYKHERKCDLSDQSQYTMGGLKTDYPDNPYNHYEKPSIIVDMNAGIIGTAILTCIIPSNDPNLLPSEVRVSESGILKGQVVRLHVPTRCGLASVSVQRSGGKEIFSTKRAEIGSCIQVNGSSFYTRPVYLAPREANQCL